jgi:hypothetical protein
MKVLFSLFLSALLMSGQKQILVSAGEQADYGVDCSFPVHTTDFRCGNLLGDRKKFYEEYMQGTTTKPATSKRISMN